MIFALIQQHTNCIRGGKDEKHLFFFRKLFSFFPFYSFYFFFLFLWGSTKISLRPPRFSIFLHCLFHVFYLFEIFCIFRIWTVRLGSKKIIFVLHKNYFQLLSTFLISPFISVSSHPRVIDTGGWVFFFSFLFFFIWVI